MLALFYQAEPLVVRTKAMKVVRIPFDPDDKVSLAPLIDFRKKRTPEGVQSVRFKRRIHRVQKTHKR